MPQIKENRFKFFLQNLGYGEDEVSQDGESNLFTHQIPITSEGNIPKNLKTYSDNNISLDYYYFKDIDEFRQKHLSVWNQNNRSSFIAVFDDKTHIIDSRQKPDILNPLSKRIVIGSFDYGVNSIGYDEQSLHLISKYGVNSSNYFDFVISHQQKRKSTEVDKDLLLNLLALRNDLVNDKNEHVIHLLILRCLFIKYLEDREVFSQGYMLSALDERDSDKLLKVFKKVRKINGDLFANNEFQTEDIKPTYLKKLSIFFGFYDYQTSQGKFFPYQFDKIPIQLISNIYESFLKEDTKKEKGVYYTPAFLVNFILKQAVLQRPNSIASSTVLDPACGSGAFLVEAFRLLIKTNNAEYDYEKKKIILQNQLFGIDTDPKALQIAAFSLYLALLEGEDSGFIQEKIRTESPILPSLLGKTLVNGNALTDDILFTINNKKSKGTFSFILANPPWGSVTETDEGDNKKLRDAIGNKSKAGTIELYQNVSDFQRSQAFVLRAQEWSNDNTIVSMVVNNSIFLNENAKGFRQDFLRQYSLNRFFELSGLNPILFKKQSIGKINNTDVEIGANEPCCVLVFEKNNGKQNKLKYISPKLNKYSENLRLIAYGSKDTKEVYQEDLVKEDLLWRIFVVGGWKDYQIIKKRILANDKNLELIPKTGFQPKKDMKQLGVPFLKNLVKANALKRYSIYGGTTEFNWNQELHRKRKDDVFQGERLLLPERILISDGFRFRSVRVKSDDIIHTDDILAIKIKRNGSYINDYSPYLAILNSKFLGYCFYHISAQWGKGASKRSTLRNSDITTLPFPSFDEISPNKIKQLSALVNLVEIEMQKGIDTSNKEEEIDNLIFDLYNLSSYERTVVNEFFEINLTKKDAEVRETDIKKYATKFIEVFRTVLDDRSKLAYEYKISSNIGAMVRFYLTKLDGTKSVSKSTDIGILNFVKDMQMSESYFSSVLSEEKIKIYTKPTDTFSIIKTNQYKDWTERSAIDDANEEIASIISSFKESKK